MVENQNAAAPLPVYLHIPTTGGVSIAAALRQAVPGLREMRSQGDIEDFNLLDPEDRKRIAAISAHIPYGVHDHIGRDCIYATMLRHPIDRLIGEHKRRMIPRGRDPASVPLRDLATKGRCAYADNNMVRRLCTYSWPINDIHWSWKVPFGEVTEDMYEQAIETLSRLAFVGIYENYEESVLGIFEAFGIPSQPVLRLNTFDYETERLQPDTEDRVMLEDLNKYDLMLHAFARERFGPAGTATMSDTCQPQLPARH